MRVSHVGHQLRVTQPTIGHHQRCGEVEAASVEGRQALIEHDLRPPELATATRSWPWGVRPTHRKVDRHHQLAVANDHEEEHAIHTVHHALVRPTPPRADHLQLAPIFSKDRVIEHPGPWPAAPGSLTPSLAMTPKRPKDLVAELAELLEPGTFGEGAQQTRGQMLVPSAR